MDPANQVMIVAVLVNRDKTDQILGNVMAGGVNGFGTQGQVLAVRNGLEECFFIGHSDDVLKIM